jgi:ribose-phosphate pyrophosphokinase
MSALIIPMPGNEGIATGVANAGGFDLGAIETRHFPDGETYLRHLTPMVGRSIALVCTLADPDPKLAPLMFAAGAARELGARRVGLIAPYLAYMRQDRRFHDGEAVSARHFAAFLSATVDWLLTVDPHLHRLRRLEDVYAIPAKALHAAPLVAEWIRGAVRNPLLIGPDAESRQWVAEAAAIIGAPFVVAQKTRRGDRNVEVELPDLAPWRGRTPVLIDDVVSSGRSLLELARLLREAGFARPVCAVVHGLFAGDSFARLSAECSMIATANTVPHASNRIDVSGIIAGEAPREAAVDG